MHPTSPARARLAVSAVFFVNGAAFANWVARIPEIQRRLGLSEAQLGLALLGLAAGSLMGMPAVGALASRRGSAPVTRALALAFCLCLPLPALAPNLPALVLALAALGAANGGMDVAMNAHGAAVERALGRPVMSSFHALFSLGGLAGALLGGAMAGAGIAPLPHFAAVGLCLSGVALLVTRALLPAAADAGGARAPAFARPDRTLAALAVVAFSCLLAEGAIGDWSAVFMQKAAGATPARAAWAYAAFSLAMAAGRLGGDTVTRRLGPAWVVRGGGLLASLGLLAAVGVARPLPGLVGFACVGLGLSCVFPCLVRAAARSTRMAGGAAIAAVATAGYSGFLAGPPFIGFVAQAFDVRVGLLLAALACLVVAALAGRMDPVAPAPAGERAPPARQPETQA